MGGVRVPYHIVYGIFLHFGGRISSRHQTTRTTDFVPSASRHARPLTRPVGSADRDRALVHTWALPLAPSSAPHRPTSTTPPPRSWAPPSEARPVCFFLLLRRCGVRLPRCKFTVQFSASICLRECRGQNHMDPPCSNQPDAANCHHAHTAVSIVIRWRWWRSVTVCVAHADAIATELLALRQFPATHLAIELDRAARQYHRADASAG